MTIGFVFPTGEQAHINMDTVPAFDSVIQTHRLQREDFPSQEFYDSFVHRNYNLMLWNTGKAIFQLKNYYTYININLLPHWDYGVKQLLTFENHRTASSFMLSASIGEPSYSVSIEVMKLQDVDLAVHFPCSSVIYVDGQETMVLTFSSAYADAPFRLNYLSRVLKGNLKPGKIYLYTN